MIVQSRENSECDAFRNRKATIIENNITALFVCTFFGSSLLRIFFSNLVIIALTNFVISSPMDFNVRSVTGIPSKQKTMHNTWPVGVWGVMYP